MTTDTTPAPSGPSIEVRRGADTTTMSLSGVRLYGHRYRLLALALCSPAIWRPGLWVLIVVAAYFLVRVVRSARDGGSGAGWGPATLVVAPLRLLQAILRALPALVGAAIGILLAVAVGMVIVGAAAGGVGVLVGLAAHHDGGWLLWADAQSSALQWASHFGPALGLYYVTAQALRSKTVDLREETVATVSEGFAWRALVDEIGEAGLVALCGACVVLALMFSFLPWNLWSPASNWRGAASGAHLTSPTDSALTSMVRDEVRSALHGCPAFAGSTEFVAANGSGVSLAVVVRPARGYFRADAVALAAALVHNRIPPVEHEVVIASGSLPQRRLTVGVNVSGDRLSVIRNPTQMLPLLSRSLPTSARLSAMAPLLRTCKS